MDARRSYEAVHSSPQRGSRGGNAAPKLEDGDASGAGPSTSRRGNKRAYQDASEINYTPEKALKAGSKMVDEVENSLKTLTLINPTREESWTKAIAKLQKDKADKPTTLIAVCGATGAGKSSILNAVLDDTIVPTSAMRACTAVVTKISHHKFREEPHPKPKEILAEVHFLSRKEWGQEVKALAGDWASHVDDGNMTDEAKIAWDKFHAVYPELEPEDLDGMTEQELIDYDHAVTAKLGKVEIVIAKDSTEFGKKIARYIDSVSKDDVVVDGEENAKLAYWPLIREVHVFCRSKALSTGAVLVDLPGVADANAARANIAMEHLKKAKHIWILAPITRAVDDQTAQKLLGDAFQKQLLMDGNYDSNRITFIASKTDDVAATEIVRGLGLNRDPEYKAIHNRTKEIKKRVTALEQRKNKLAQVLQEVKAKRDELKRSKESCNQHLVALETKTLATWATLPSTSNLKAAGTKRKAKLPCVGKPGPSKVRRRRKGGQSEYSSDSDSDSDSDDSRDELDAFSGDDIDAEYEEVTPELEEVYDPAVLRRKVQEIDDEIETLDKEISGVTAEGKKVIDEKAVVDQEMNDAQRAKDAFCALKRNEASKGRLKEDFRTGLRKLEEVEAERRDGAAFDPTQNTRDYDALDLQVFTCSSRDYVRLRGQVEGDGAASCFSSVEETEIPALQDYCHTLTLPSRRAFTKHFLNRVSNLVSAVETYVKPVQVHGEAAAVHRLQLAYRWDTNKVHVRGCVGITQRLRNEFAGLALKCADDLNKTFKIGLEEKCREGAKVASDSAIEVIEKFATIHHATYRATMKRYGSWRRDVNVELVDPFTQTIARSFSSMFEKDIFGPLEISIRNCIAQLMTEFIESAAEELKHGAHSQQKECRKEIRTTLDHAMVAVKETMSTQRKEISRSVAPHIKQSLMESYENARREKGKGSVARMKSHFRAYVEQQKATMFSEAAETILVGLENAANAVGETLKETLFDLAEKVEVNLAVVWEDVRSGHEEIAARAEAQRVMCRIKHQIDLWLEAARCDEEGPLAVVSGVNEDADMY